MFVNQFLRLSGARNEGDEQGARHAYAGWSVAGVGFLALTAGFGLSLDLAPARVAQPIPTIASLTVSAPPAAASHADPFEAIRVTSPETSGSPPVVAPLGALQANPYIAVVIDDVGADPAGARRAIALPAPVTLSLLSNAPGVTTWDARARAAGHEVFVHLAMEPRGLADPGPDALTTWQSTEDITQRTAAAFDAVPGAVGFNNHMGSRFTQCGACLAPVLAAAEARGFIVLDSVTDARSRLGDLAQASGLATLRRDVFLDHEPGGEAVRARLAEAENLARTRGWAVVIGHPREETLNVLEDWMAGAGGRGFDIGPASVAIERAERVHVSF